MGWERCHLWKPGTQTVFGDGPSTAELMGVFEQPGDTDFKRIAARVSKVAP